MCLYVCVSVCQTINVRPCHGCVGPFFIILEQTTNLLSFVCYKHTIGGLVRDPTTFLSLDPSGFSLRVCSCLCSYTNNILQSPFSEHLRHKMRRVGTSAFVCLFVYQILAVVRLTLCVSPANSGPVASHDVLHFNRRPRGSPWQWYQFPGLLSEATSRQCRGNTNAVRPTLLPTVCRTVLQSYHQNHPDEGLQRQRKGSVGAIQSSFLQNRKRCREHSGGRKSLAHKRLISIGQWKSVLL